jgi:hypothetical protein
MKLHQFCPVFMSLNQQEPVSFFRGAVVKIFLNISGTVK